MSETTSAADGTLFRHPAGVSGLGALALGALRAAGAGTPPPAGRGAGAAGAAAEAIGRAAAGGDSDRSRSVPVPRRRPSQGPRTASDPGWDPSRPPAGAARHAGARTALPAPRASGRREDPRREGHHSGAQRDVGDGRRAGIHARRRVGAGSSRQSNTGTRSAWGGTCAKSGAVSRHSIRLRKGSNGSMARWTPTSPAGWRFGWIMAVSTCQTTSSSRSGIGGSTPSFGFVEEPETNGVVERWNRTLKEQAIHGRIFQNLEAVRAAVADFVERYNQTWRLEKLGYHTPTEAREEYELRQAA